MLNEKRTYFKFENLDIWNHARILVNEIYRSTKKFPKSELFGLTNQLRRAASSVMLNIAEGSERHSDQDFQRFLKMAIASLNEVIAALYVALDQNFIEKDKFDELREDGGHLSAKMKSFVKTLTKRSSFDVKRSTSRF